MTRPNEQEDRQPERLKRLKSKYELTRPITMMSIISDPGQDFSIYKCTQPSTPGSTQAHTHFLSCFIPGTGLHHRYGLRVAAHINEKLLSLGVPVTKTNNKNSAFQKSKMQ